MNAAFAIFKSDGVPKSVAWLRICETDAEKRRGLSGIRSMGPSEGMLFPGSSSFWMKGTYVDLDIAFIKDGRIVETMDMPSENGGFSKTYSCPEADSAVELPSGYIGRFGISVGDTVEVQWRR